MDSKPTHIQFITNKNEFYTVPIRSLKLYYGSSASCAINGRWVDKSEYERVFKILKDLQKII